MRILILGANGLIGYTLWKQFQEKYDTYAVTRLPKATLAEHTSLFESDKVIDKIDISDFHHLTGIIRALRPECILNGTGVTKRRHEIHHIETALTINSLFPHKLAEWCLGQGIRLINFSTDCVFHGDSGDYNEESITTAIDNYGRTKAFGEVTDMMNCVTIRSSFIGREIMHKTELLEWFLAQDGKSIKGFTNALYSGVSTIQMSKVVSHILDNFPNLHGLYQLAPEKPISKYDLLCIAKKAFGSSVQIVTDDSFISNKSLNGSKLKNEIGFEVPSWNTMMTELAQDK